MLDPAHGPGSALTLAWYGSPQSVVVFGSGILTTPNSTSRAITYDPDLAPVGAALTAAVIPTSEGSTAELTVFGLLPNRGYAVYAYTKACGATADAAGAPFQNRPDPRTLSTNPDDANRDNEIALAVQTDTAGAGTSHTRVPFTLTDRAPGSIVVHDEVAPTAAGKPPTTGNPIACLTLSRRQS